MKKYDYIFFDLDGTISDSAPGIVNAVVYALERMGTPVGGRERLKKFVGPPLYDTFRDYIGYSQAETDRAVQFFRRYYRARGILENTMYPGVDTLLQKLVAAGRKPVLATSKPEPFAREIIARYGLSGYFTFIAGSTMDETRAQKSEVVAYALKACGIKDPSRAVMVGDRLYDVRGAAENGLGCIGVLYGYGTREELETAGAVAVAEDLPALANMLI